MAQPFGLPSFPPASPWELYAWYVIYVPFAARLLLLGRPFWLAMDNLKDHGRWIIKRVNAVPGLKLLITDSLLAFLTPLLLVFFLRWFSDPLGWGTWGEIPPVGLAVLVSSLLLWVAVDMMRVLASRQLFQELAVKDLDRLKWQVDAVFAARGVLHRLSTVRLVREAREASLTEMLREEERLITEERAAEQVAAKEARKAEKAAAAVEADAPDEPETGAGRLLGRMRRGFNLVAGRVSEASVDLAKRTREATAPAAEKVVQVAGAGAAKVASGTKKAARGSLGLADRVFELPRKGASVALDKVDARIEGVIEQRRKAMAITLLRDLSMGAAPLIVLWLLPWVSF